MFKTVVIGRPNVGKSSLYNALLGYRRTIVLDMPGTTVDLISEKPDWAPIELIDTQGIFGEGDTEVLAKALSEADVCLFVVDGKVGKTPFDAWIGKEIHLRKVPTLLIINKSEAKASYGEEEFTSLKFKEVTTASASHRTGVEFIKEWCIAKVPKTEVAEEAKDIKDVIKVAFVGRPNTGKSTLMNLLCQQVVSRVSPIPLTTRDPVSFEFVSNEINFKLTDTAGMRRPRSKKEDVETFSIQATTRTMRDSDVVFLLINASEAITDQDMRLLSLLEREGRPAAVLLNFWDVLGSKERKDFISNSDFAKFLESYKVFPISGKSLFNTSRLLPLAKRLYKQSHQRVATSKLNKILEAMVTKNPPPNMGRQNFNLLYASQVRVDPPTFVFFMNRKANLPTAYQNYISNQLRQKLNLESQAIRVFFRGGD